MNRINQFEGNKLKVIVSIYLWLQKKIKILTNLGLDGTEDVIYIRRVRLTNFICLNSVFWLFCFGVYLSLTNVLIAACICFLCTATNFFAYQLSIRRNSRSAYYIMNISNLISYILYYICYGRINESCFLFVLWLISVIFLSDKLKAYIVMFLVGVVSYLGLEVYLTYARPLLPMPNNIYYIHFFVLIACFVYLISLFEFIKHTNRIYQASLEGKNKQLLKYYKAIEQTNATIVITDINGNIEYANPQFEVITGYTVEEVLGKNPRILKSNRTSPEEYKELWDTITHGGVWHGEFLNLSKNKEEFIERAIISPIIDTDGNIINYIAIKDNITELKKAEQALIESQRKYKLLADNSADVIWTLDIKTLRFTYISPSIFQLRGLTVEEAMAETMSDSLVADSYQRALEKLGEALIAYKSGNLKFKGVGDYQQFHKNGSIVNVEISSNVIFDEQNNPKEILGVSRNITKRKKAEQALLESEAKFKLIAENTHDVIWKIDLANFQYNYISPSVYSVRGFTVDEAMSQTVEESLTPESYKKAIERVNDYLQKVNIPNLNIREQFQQPCKDGRIIDIELSASFIRNEKGEPVEILGVTRDISKRIQAELALKKSEAKLAKLLERQTLKNQRLSNQLESIYNNTINAVAFFDIEGPNIILSSCNYLWAKNLGCSVEEIEGVDIVSFCDLDTQILYRKYIYKAIDAGKSIQEYINWHNLYLHVIVFPLKDELTGEFLSCASFVYNVTDKHEAQQKIKETEEKFQSIFNNSTDAIVVFTPNLTLLEVNEYYYHLTGFIVPKGRMTVAELARYVPEKYHLELYVMIKDLIEGRKITSYECELCKADGHFIPVELNSSLFYYNDTPIILCMIRDITARKSMERKLTHIGVQTETRERRKLAIDLHDNVGPLLSSMNMYLSALFLNPEIKKHSESFEDVRRILKESIAAVREISNNISPHVLTSYGLSAALYSFFETKNKLIEINIDDKLSDLRFSETKEIMVYNVIKEAFNNTIKYANASTINIKLAPYKENIHISYSDNGIGFVLAEKLETANQSLGLFSMINRIKILEGTYQIKTAPTEGFVLDIWFPIENL